MVTTADTSMAVGPISHSACMPWEILHRKGEVFLFRLLELLLYFSFSLVTPKKGEVLPELACGSWAYLSF